LEDLADSRWVSKRRPHGLRRYVEDVHVRDLRGGGELAGQKYALHLACIRATFEAVKIFFAGLGILEVVDVRVTWSARGHEYCCFSTPATKPKACV